MEELAKINAFLNVETNGYADKDSFEITVFCEFNGFNFTTLRMSFSSRKGSRRVLIDILCIFWPLGNLAFRRVQ